MDIQLSRALQFGNSLTFKVSVPLSFPLSVLLLSYLTWSKSVLGLLLVGSGIALLALPISLLLYSILDQNSRMRRLPALIHEVNHRYRDVLCGAFSNTTSTPCNALRVETDDDIKKLLRAEHDTLECVCDLIAEAFIELTAAKCVATAKLAYRENDGRYYCKTLARSGEYGRDHHDGTRQAYEISAKRNTGLYQAALLPNKADQRQCFYSADLLALGDDYKNERHNWSRFYRSTIVIPIQGVRNAELERPHLRGFLCIDTKKTNMLDNRDHVELLSSFADQMYNFMSLMRGAYSVNIDSVVLSKLQPDGMSTADNDTTKEDEADAKG